MDTLKAMATVSEHLTAGDVAGAQAIVIEIERTACVLPSSTFERVLRAAVAGDCLTEDYRAWCQRAYGRAGFASLLASIQAARS